MSRGPDAATMLLRSLDQSAQRAGTPMTIIDSDWTRWASATFSGARHNISLSAPASPDVDRWLIALPEAELVLRGHLVADLVIASVNRDDQRILVQLEVLTVEE